MLGPIGVICAVVLFATIGMCILHVLQERNHLAQKHVQCLEDFKHDVLLILSCLGTSDEWDDDDDDGWDGDDDPPDSDSDPTTDPGLCASKTFTDNYWDGVKPYPEADFTSRVDPVSRVFQNLN